MVGILALAVLNAGVEILFILPHHDDIHSGMLGFDEGRIGYARADIGKEAECGPDRDI